MKQDKLYNNTDPQLSEVFFLYDEDSQWLYITERAAAYFEKLNFTKAQIKSILFQIYIGFRTFRENGHNGVTFYRAFKSNYYSFNGPFSLIFKGEVINFDLKVKERIAEDDGFSFYVDTYNIKS